MDRTHTQPYQGTCTVARTPDPRSSSAHSNSQQPSRSKESGRGSDTRTAVPRHVVRRTHTCPPKQQRPQQQPAAKQKQGVRTWIGHTHSRTKARGPSHAHLTPEAAAPTATASSPAEARSQDVDRTHAQPYQGTWSVARAPNPRSSSAHSNSQQPSRSKESGRGSDTRTAVPRHVVRRTHT